jgi:hypothetical protein
MCIQIKDSITIKGIKYSLYTTPLDSYWTKRNPKPGIRVVRTSCRRGYIATWELSDNCLYIINMIFYAPGKDRGLDYVFPFNTRKIMADWFTGELQIPIGDELDSAVIWDTVFDSDWFIKVKRGKVKSQRYKANY